MGKAIKALKLLLAEIDALDNLSIELTGKPSSYIHLEQETDNSINLIRNAVQKGEEETND